MRLTLLPAALALLLVGCPAPRYSSAEDAVEDLQDDDDAALSTDDDDATLTDDDDATLADDDDSDPPAEQDDDDATADDDDSACEPFVDLDGDGYDRRDDCNDEDATIHPGGVEQCNSGDDEDCAPDTSCDHTCLESFDFGQCGALAPAPAAPILHWDFDARGPGSVLDSVSGGTAGWFTGNPTFADGMVGDGVVLDGTSWILADSSLSLPGDRFSLVTWVRVNAGDNVGPYTFLMSNGNGLPAWTGASTLLRPGDVFGGLIEGGSGPQELLPTGGAVCDGGWAQVATTFESGIVTLYVDGEAAPTTNAAYTEVPWGEQPFGVGNDPNNLTRALVGELDEAMVFDVPLSPADLSSLRTDALCGS